MENLGDYERSYVDRLFIEYHELFKTKIDLSAKLIVREKQYEIISRDINDIATKFHQLKAMYDSLLVEHENLKSSINIQAEETVKAKKGAK